MLFSKQFLILAIPACLAAADVKVLEEIIAKVNGDIVTQSEVAKSRQSMIAELKTRGAKDPDVERIVKDREKEILRDRIDQLLLIQKAKELNINVDPEISKQVADIQKEAAKGNPGLVDPDKFQAYVKEQTGMSFEDYKSEMRNSMLTQRVIRQEVGKQVNIPKADLRKYYDEHSAEFVRKEQVFLTEIFLSTAGKDAAGQAAAEKKAKDLIVRTKKGEKFPELAASNSDSESAKQGGFLGGQPKDDLRKEIVDAIWEKSRGYITDPALKFDNGFLILKVEDHHKAGQADFEEVENEIQEKIYMTKFQPKVREYLTQLRQDAFLEVKEGFIDSGAAPGKLTNWTDPTQLRPETVSKEEVSSKQRRKRLLWVAPVPGSKTADTSRSSSKT